MNITTLGIDLAKDVFQLHAIDERGKTLLTKRVKRHKLADEIAKLPICKIGMEACGGAHYWARRFQAMGHEVKLMSPQFVKPYVKGNKNDANDAEACCEAVTRPSMRFVPIKQTVQQDMQALHRVRRRLVSQRTQFTDQMRGLLAEYGIVIAQGIASVMRKLPLILEDADNELSTDGRTLFSELYEELKFLQIRIQGYEDRIKQIAKIDERCLRLQTIPGIGPITATAFLSSVGDINVFTRGRQLSAYLGLVPKQSSSGNKTRLLGISKRGDRYLRCLLIHGARSVIKVVDRKSDPYSRWIQTLITRCGIHKATVAVANKNARIAWALLKNNSEFKVNNACEFVDNYAVDNQAVA